MADEDDSKKAPEPKNPPDKNRRKKGRPRKPEDNAFRAEQNQAAWSFIAEYLKDAIAGKRYSFSEHLRQVIEPQALEGFRADCADMIKKINSADDAKAFVDAAEALAGQQADEFRETIRGLPGVPEPFVKEHSQEFREQLKVVAAEASAAAWNAVKDSNPNSEEKRLARSGPRKRFLAWVHAEYGKSPVDIGKEPKGPDYKTIMNWAEGWNTPQTPNTRGQLHRALNIPLSKIPE